MSTSQTSSARMRSQDQAEWAYALVKQWTDKADDRKKEIKSHLRKLPSHLHTSGLAQTLLFYAKQHPVIASELCSKLLGDADVVAGVQKLARGEPSEYRRKAREAMVLAVWLKRYVEAMVRDD